MCIRNNSKSIKDHLFEGENDANGNRMAVLKILVFLCTCALVPELHASAGAENFLKMLEFYDPRIPPIDNSGPPMRINVSLYILDLMRVDDLNQEITTQMYFRQAWYDRRLRYQDDSKPDKYLIHADLDKIWHPDLFFVDEANAKMNTVPFHNTFIRWGKEGNMLMSVRMTITHRCRMDFSYFPHDRHNCTFQIESYGYNAELVSLAWDNVRGPIGITNPVQVNNFIVTDMKNSVERAELSLANYTRLTMELTIARKPGFYMTKVYIPYILLTCVAFVSLWISHKLVMVRISLMLTVLFIMFALASHVQFHIPRVTYTKAIDVWMAFCIAIVFSVFLEFVFLLMNLKSRKEPQDSVIASLDAETADKEGKETNSRRFLFSANLFQSKSRKNSSSKMDYASRFIFPLLFGLFNVIYWSICIS